MKKIELFANALPVLKWFSLSSLPLTDRPLEWKPSASSMSGLIVGDRRVKMTSSSWLSTDEIQFLFAFLMRNIDGNTGFLHVLSSSITKNIHDVHDLMPVMIKMKDNAPNDVKGSYQANLDAIFKYIESRLDILEHKFLVFPCNTNSNHWVSVVVINPFLVVDVNKRTGAAYNSDLCDDDEIMAGWCVMNSNPSVGSVEDSGFQGTAFTKNKATFGVRLFLNICASFIKFKKDNEGDVQALDDLHVFQYEEPFGDYQDEMGTNNFPRIDLPSPTIIEQNNGFDCGLAAVANSMAFVKHHKDFLFTKGNLKRCVTTGSEVRYEVAEDIFGMKSFFDRIMLDALDTKHYLIMRDSMTLMRHMRVELLDLVDKIAFDSITDVKLFDEVKKQLEKIVSYSASRMKPKEQAQSSKAKEESQTIVKPAAITRRKKKNDKPEGHQLVRNKNVHIKGMN
jgi:hypothetical protein